MYIIVVQFDWNVFNSGEVASFDEFYIRNERMEQLCMVCTYMSAFLADMQAC